MMNKYKNRLDEILDDTFELKCRMLFLVANLKNNKNTIYKVSISNYLDKIYNIIDYINKINIKSEEDMLFCNILLKLYLCYLKVLYNKLLDMFDLQTKRLFDNYESIKTSNKMKKEKYLNKYYIELLSDYNYLDKLIWKLFKNIKKLVKLNISNDVSIINNIDYYGNEIFNILH